MWVILTYDTGVKRNSRVLKTCRKYLHHVQKSVFEGEITNKNLGRLKHDLERYIDSEQDQVAIYVLTSQRNVSKDVIGYCISMDNVI